MIIRAENPSEAALIRSVVETAFRGVEHSSQTEGAIVDALRRSGALAVSLVAEVDGAIVGHIAFSPVRIDGEDPGWFGLGPVAVLPEFQNREIGSGLIREGLRQLKARGAAGCVVLGDPAFYGRFGFTSDHGLRYGDVPAEYFQSLVMSGHPAKGEVSYDTAFDAR